MKNYFPTLIAEGKAFCNRTKETEHLLYNIDAKIPSLLVSPRRYGKTSLALQALTKSKYPYAHVDLYKALDEHEIAQYILNGISQLIGQIEKTPKKLLNVARDFLSSLQLKIFLHNNEIAIQLTQQEKRPVDLILAALEKLDEYITKHSKVKCGILFLDEFQTLAEVSTNKSIEAGIREAMQKAKSLVYIFAGSNRHLIERMFNDDSRPFFNSCDQIRLGRISEEHYIKQINKAAQDRWKTTLPSILFTVIFNCSERHPYYVNKLCSLIFREPHLPTSDTVNEIWRQYVNENIARVEQEAVLLKLNQRRLLIQLAQAQYIENPFSNEYSKSCGMAPTSIHRAMNFLLEKDYVFKDKDSKYRVLDPLIKSALAN